MLTDDHPVGSFVLRQTALDMDSDDVITYTIRNDPEGEKQRGKLQLNVSIALFYNFSHIFIGRYSISPEGVVTTKKPMTTAPDHVFDIIATDKASHTAVLHVHVTIVGNKKGPEWIFPAFEGDKIVVCEVKDTKRCLHSCTCLSAADATSSLFLEQRSWFPNGSSSKSRTSSRI